MWCVWCGRVTLPSVSERFGGLIDGAKVRVLGEGRAWGWEVRCISSSSV